METRKALNNYAKKGFKWNSGKNMNCKDMLKKIKKIEENWGVGHVELIELGGVVKFRIKIFCIG